MKTGKSPPKIAVLLDSARGYERMLLRGIWRYVKLHGPWILFRTSPYYQRFWGLLNESPAELKRAEVEGVIAHYRPGLCEFRNLGLPLVIVPGMEIVEGAVNLVNDDERIGAMGADHLANLGLTNLAYAGYRSLCWSVGRMEGFCRRVSQLVLVPRHHLVSFRASRLGSGGEKALVAWLERLPKPVGLMACNDEFALSIRELCRIHDLQVPEQVAILGVDNDEMICEQTSPPLSSIELSVERAGYEAADLLDRMLRGEPTAQRIVAEPLRVVARPSTDWTVIEDREVAAAIHFVRQNSKRVLQVKQVVKACGISRRNLADRFLRIVGRTIADEIHFRRVEHIKLMLTETNQSISQIAKDLGYIHDRHFARYFHRQTGITPRVYRKRYGPI